MIELQAGSPGRSPQCHPRRSRAVASRDVMRRCSDATSRQGQPTVMVAWQPLFALLLPFESRLPSAILPPTLLSHLISQPHSLSRVHVPLLNELSPPSLPFSLSRSLALSLSLSLSLFFSYFPTVPFRSP